MTTVITYGTFDMFHIGHLRLLQRLRDRADKLIVGISTDEFNSEKGKKCIIPYDQRSEIVKNINGVSLVIPERSWEQKKNDIKKYSVDVFAMGDDWSGKFDHLNGYCKVLYLPRTQNISTSHLKSILSPLTPESKADLLRVFELLDSIKSNLK